MAKKGKGKAKKSGLPLDVEQKILGMGPTDLAVEVTFERNAIDALNKQKKDNDQLNELKAKVKEFDDTLKTIPEVLKAKDKLEEVKADNMTDDHLEAKANLAALSKGWSDDIKDRKKKLQYMEKTLSRHIESGALKRKSP